MKIKKSRLLKLKIQRTLDLIIFLPLCESTFFLFKYWFGFKIKEMDASRKLFKELAKDPSPLMICANHLTYIDSILIMWALGKPTWYIFNFSKLSWNLPASQYAKNPLFLFFCYFGKSLFIKRGGSRSHVSEILDCTRYLLQEGEVVTIFPEGTRSRTGSFNPEKLTHGAAKVISELQNCRVLCLYLRSEIQETYAGFPPKNSNFVVKTQLIKPSTSKSGREGYQEIMSQIGTTIKGLENQYFPL